ncbi:TsoY family (seleno)protein [Mesobacterium pallidum]|uniref:TsoY family (seleno)protein n=1 Tax=Mesobacterium pallidum TaxID=2872037 RepID=UPI001EE2CA1E|nr:hypothetical protein [Mesobacterium pallidum]
MPSQVKRPADSYSPLYFLSSVGAGGVAVTFFMFLMFWVPHPDRPVPIFEDIVAAWARGNLPQQVAIAIAMGGIALFAVLNLKALVWNIAAIGRFKQTEAYTKLRNSNAESTLAAYPLAVAMSINASFIVGLVFVPGLWSVVEYLFPAAMAAFFLTGLFALRTIGHFLGRVLTKGGVFDMTAHNSFAQMLPAFSLAMVGVGFAAPAAMSATPQTVAAALVLSTFFGIGAILYGLYASVTGFASMLHYGTARESGPTLMIMVPLMTILGILFMRQTHGLHVTFDVHASDAETMMFLIRLVSVQVVFLLLGTLVLRAQGYFSDFVLGSRTSPGSYALVCPAVAFNVLGMFLVHKGFVAAGVLDKFSAGYWAITAVFLAAQAIAVLLVFRLNRQHFGKPAARVAVPAE